MVSGSILFTPALRPRLARRVFAIALGALLLASRGFAGDLSSQASWVPASALETPDGIRRAINNAVAAGIRTIVAPAPLYTSAGPDRFLELVRQAHEHQLQIYASIDIDRVALSGEVPASRNHVVYQHPEWLMVPRALAPELMTVDVRSPEYFGRLARWTRANGVDGVYLSPVPDDAAAFVVSMTADVLKRYPVDGVQLDTARYPADDFDYGRRVIDVFRQDMRSSLQPAERARVDADETIDPFAYPNAFPEAWRRFRQQQLTRLIAQVRGAITKALPGLPVVASVSGVADNDLQNHLQDWRSWIERRLVDAVSIRTGLATTIVSDANQLVRIAEAASNPGSR